MPPSSLARAGLAASLLAIVAATMLPLSRFVGHSHWARVELWPSLARLRPLDFALNVVLFVPFGLTLARSAAWPTVAVVACAAVMSVGIEATQLFFHSRSSTVMDVIANVSGAAVGSWLACRAAATRAAPRTETGVE